MITTLHQIFWLFLIPISTQGSGATAEVKLGEQLTNEALIRIEVRVSVDGDVTLPAKEKTKPQRLKIVGSSKLVYDERTLPRDDADRLLRIYRQIEIQRMVGDTKQTADIRPEVRRMVVLRTPMAKSPFSPDGPLTWNEIDVVKNDIFAPVLAAGLLPGKLVKPGDTWSANSAAVRELTDLEKITSGELTLTYVGAVTFDGKQRARLNVAGTLTGVDDHGPARHTIEGTAYVDLDSSLLSYLSVKGSHELLDGEGKTSGRIDGRFTMTRALIKTEDLTDDAIAKLELKPTAANTRLLYENKDLGVRFVHSRRWRVGAVQGRQVTLDGPNGAGMLITVESAKTLPTADDFQKETLEFVSKAKGTTTNASRIERIRSKPAVDRFGFDADMDTESVRLEYAVITGRDGGATVAARLPRRDAKALCEDVEVVLKEFNLIK